MRNWRIRSAPKASCSRSSCDQTPRIRSGYEIVAGERRWRAAQQAGLHSVPVIVRELTDREVLELAIIENVQRADLNAIEEAAGYRDLIERFNYSQEQLSEIIGKSRSHVANTLRLLKLPAQVQSLVQDGKLTAGHARALIGRPDAQVLAEQIIATELNVREVEALVSGGADTGANDGGSSFRKMRDKDPDTKAFEKELSRLAWSAGRDQARVGRERQSRDQIRKFRPARVYPDAPFGYSQRLMRSRIRELQRCPLGVASHRRPQARFPQPGLLFSQTLA